ncbi:MAG: hypothetical protein CM1200mP26_23650 [Acidimicrobiales bacterium]|nr:MAG: hypothetical protein CM1200mP26_23650 [Acidimicrobiales bacterium]
MVNDTRVLPARLRLRRSTGGMAEVLLCTLWMERFGDPALEIGAPWEALVRPSRRLPPGSELSIGGDPLVRDLVVEVGLDLGEGRRHVTLWTSDGDLLAALERHGGMPLPPYIEADLADPERYQTVFSDRPASAAAPTAGLISPMSPHRCGVCRGRVERLELVVGLDTFRPVTVADLDDHRMHRERYRVDPTVMEACRRPSVMVAGWWPWGLPPLGRWNQRRGSAPTD